MQASIYFYAQDLYYQHQIRWSGNGAKQKTQALQRKEWELCLCMAMRYNLFHKTTPIFLSTDGCFWLWLWSEWMDVCVCVIAMLGRWNGGGKIFNWNRGSEEIELQ